MPTRRLPQNSQTLEIALKTCNDQVNAVAKLKQRDQVRLDEICNLTADSKALSNAARRTEQLEESMDEVFLVGLDDTHILSSLVDPKVIRKAGEHISSGIKILEAAARSNLSAEKLRTKLRAGYKKLIEGHLIHLQELRSLQHDLIHALEAIAGKDPSLPMWDSATGELTYEGKLAKEVQTNASQQRKILDLFEKQGWPSRLSLDDVFDDEQVRRHAKRLKKNCSLITFTSSSSKEAGTGICWQTEKRHGSATEEA
ncbi:MAG: hypothetical protein RH917_20840 [Lacipirellulaceae bacterium]